MYTNDEENYPAEPQPRHRPKSKGGIDLTQDNLKKLAKATRTKSPDANSEASSVPTNICPRKDYEKTTATRRPRDPVPTNDPRETQPLHRSRERYTERSSGKRGKSTVNDTRRGSSSEHHLSGPRDSEHTRDRSDHHRRKDTSQELAKQSKTRGYEPSAYTDHHETQLVETRPPKSPRPDRRSSTDKSLVPSKERRDGSYDDGRSERSRGERDQSSAEPYSIHRGLPTLATYQGPLPDDKTIYWKTPTGQTTHYWSNGVWVEMPWGM